MYTLSKGDFKKLLLYLRNSNEKVNTSMFAKEEFFEEIVNSIRTDHPDKEDTLILTGLYEVYMDHYGKFRTIDEYCRRYHMLSYEKKNAETYIDVFGIRRLR